MGLPPSSATAIPWWRHRRLLPWLLQIPVALLLLVVIAFLLRKPMGVEL